METDEGGGSSARLRQFWAELDLDCGWDDLILPERQLELLRSVCEEFRTRAENADRAGHRNYALRILFAGAPGTGKTTAAKVLASAMGMNVVRVDLDALASSDEEEAEKSLQDALGAARRANAIALFDEAEALFGRQSGDGARRVRRGADTVARLLSQLDVHADPVIFAVRLKARLDDDALRLADFVIDFPFPEADARERLWRRLLPDTAHVHQADLQFLAGSFKLTGGAIHRCAAAASHGAAVQGEPVSLRHIAAALEDEYSGRLLSSATALALERVRARAAADTGAPREPLAAGAAGSPAVTTRSDVAAPPAPQPQPQPRRQMPRPRRPMPVRVPPADASRRRARLALLGAGVVAAGALIGALVANAVGGSGSTPSARTARAVIGGVRVSYPADWSRRSAPARPRLALADEFALVERSPSPGTLVIGLATPSGYGLPPTVNAALVAPSSPQVVTLGGARYLRYVNASLDGSRHVSLYALPTSAGTIVAACLSSAAGSQFAAQCERVVASVRPTSGTVQPLGPSETYAAALNAVIAKLNRARAADDRRLHEARTPAQQAHAAAALAAAHASAATAIAGLDAGPAKSPNLALAGGLRAASRAYDALARAAAHGDASAYTAAKASVSKATATVSAALSRLASLGYAVR